MRAPLAVLATLLAGLALSGSATAQSVAARIGVIPIVGAAPVFVANGEGWLREAGITPTFTTFESGPNMIQALASGTIDVYVAGIAPLAVARSKGIDVRVVAATAIEEMVVVAGPKLAPYFAGGADKAEAFRRFRAKEGRAARLATQPLGSVPHTTLVHWLREVAKADKADAEVVAMGIDATQQAMLAGAVDGAALREPALTIVQGRNPAITLIATGGRDVPEPARHRGGGVRRLRRQEPRRRRGAGEGRDPRRRPPEVRSRRAAIPVEAALGKASPMSPPSRRRSPRRPRSSPPIRAPSSRRRRRCRPIRSRSGRSTRRAPLDGLFDARAYEKAVAP